MVKPIESPALAELPGVSHGYFTREGGVSKGVYDSLNIGFGSDDAHDDVAQNRQRIAGHLDVSSNRLFVPYQVHSPDAVYAETDFNGSVPKADAVVACQPGHAVGISTADCGPVLFADADNGVVGAAHAGWRGAFTGVLESTLEAMESKGARRDRIHAVLGPTISGDNYEVGPEFVERFLDAAPANSAYFRSSDRPGHAYFDLPAYIVNRLRSAGVDKAHSLGLCTYADEERFFSYRRSVHRKEPDYGRLMAAIVLTG